MIIAVISRGDNLSDHGAGGFASSHPSSNHHLEGHELLWLLPDCRLDMDPLQQVIVK